MESPDERHRIFVGVPLLANRLQAAYDDHFGELTLKQWLALMVVRRLPHPVASTAVVADALGTSHQNATKLLRALTEKGFLALSPSAADRRARQITLTPRATAFLTQHADAGELLLDALFADIPSADLVATARTLDALAARLGRNPASP